jgi:two-component system, NarL family, nitrate/nitrite response regulator NarL
MGMKIMIVDDHDGMRNMIRHLIAAPGDTIQEFATAGEALRVAGEFKPDCVTMDISMPGLGAFEAVRDIRKAYPPARVIFVSSHEQSDYRRMAQEAGAVGYVTKDNLSELYLLVATKRLLTSLKV